MQNKLFKPDLSQREKKEHISLGRMYVRGQRRHVGPYKVYICVLDQRDEETRFSHVRPSVMFR